MLHGNFHVNVSLFALAVNDLRVQHFFLLIEILHVFFDAAFVVEGEGNRLFLSQIRQNDLQVSREKRHLSEPLPQHGKIKDRLLENLRVRQETYFRSSPLRLADHSQRVHDLTPLISLAVNLALVADIYLQPYGKGVNYGSAHAVKTSGYLISPAAELAAGMKNGKDHLHGRDAFFLVYAHRDASSVVPHGDGIILVDKYFNGIAVSCQSFVDGVIDNLVYQMVEALG